MCVQLSVSDLFEEIGDVENMIMQFKKWYPKMILVCEEGRIAKLDRLKHRIEIGYESHLAEGAKRLAALIELSIRFGSNGHTLGTMKVGRVTVMMTIARSIVKNVSLRRMVTNVLCGSRGRC